MRINPESWRYPGAGGGRANGAVPKITDPAVAVTALVVGIVLAGGSDRPLFMAALAAGICAMSALSFFIRALGDPAGAGCGGTEEIGESMMPMQIFIRRMMDDAGRMLM